MGHKDTEQPVECSIVPRWVGWSVSAASSPRPNKSQQRHMVSRPLCARRVGWEAAKVPSQAYPCSSFTPLLSYISGPGNRQV